MKKIRGITFEQVMAHRPCYDENEILELFAGRKFLTINEIIELKYQLKIKYGYC